MRPLLNFKRFLANKRTSRLGFISESRSLPKGNENRPPFEQSSQKRSNQLVRIQLQTFLCPPPLLSPAYWARLLSPGQTTASLKKKLLPPMGNPLPSLRHALFLSAFPSGEGLVRVVTVQSSWRKVPVFACDAQRCSVRLLPLRRLAGRTLVRPSARFVFCV